jgi:hypothetical protein
MFCIAFTSPGFVVDFSIFFLRLPRGIICEFRFYKTFIARQTSLIYDHHSKQTCRNIAEARNPAIPVGKRQR